MLILTRRIGEVLRIGDDVSITVLGVKGNQVRIGIDAPRMSPCIAKRSTSASSAKRVAHPSWMTKRSKVFLIQPLPEGHPSG